jgi:hypothetical protein
MRVVRPSILKWFVTGLFAVVAITGQALHSLPGCGHCPCDDHGSPTCAGHACDARVQSGHESSDCGHSAADCSICKFFSQAKILGHAWHSGGDTPLVASIALLPAAFYPTAPVHAFDARGPPAAPSVIL